MGSLPFRVFSSDRARFEKIVSRFIVNWDEVGVACSQTIGTFISAAETAVIMSKPIPPTPEKQNIMDDHMAHGNEGIWCDRYAPPRKIVNGGCSALRVELTNHQAVFHHRVLETLLHQIQGMIVGGGELRKYYEKGLR